MVKAEYDLDMSYELVEAEYDLDRSYPCIIPQRTRHIIYTISLNNSQGYYSRGQIIIFFHVIKRQLLEGGDY